jgi:hypothetical protein
MAGTVLRAVQVESHLTLTTREVGTSPRMGEKIKE